MRKKFYNDKFEETGGACEICLRKERLVVDHNHNSGAMRGLLCYSCNAGLGMFLEKREVLSNAINYLDRTSDLPPSEIKVIRKARIDDIKAAIKLIDDPNWESDRARARQLANITGLTEGAAQSRIIRTRKNRDALDALCCAS